MDSNRRWIDRANDFNQKIALPQANQVDTAYRGYLKDIVLIAGAFAAIGGTFMVREGFESYPSIPQISLIGSIIAFIVVAILGVWHLGTHIEELIPGVTYAQKTSGKLSELSYLQSLLAEKAISPEDYSRKEAELFKDMDKARRENRSSGVNDAEVDKNARKMLSVVKTLKVFFVIGISLFVVAMFPLLVFV